MMDWLENKQEWPFILRAVKAKLHTDIWFEIIWLRAQF